MANWAKLLWDILLTLSLLLIIVALVAEFLSPLDAKTVELIHYLYIFALSFLFVELANDFYRASDKKKFVTKEWLLILSFLPFGTIFRLGSVFKSSRIVKFLSNAWERLSKMLKLERVGFRTAQLAVHASRASKIIRPIAQAFKKKDKELNKLRKGDSG